MANEVQGAAEPGIVPLLKGIVNDIGDLIKQQLQFARAEIRSDLKKTGQASMLLVVGAAAAAVGGLLLCLMLVHLLHWLSLPANVEQAGLPLWACYAIVGGVFTVGGVLTVLGGKARLESFNPLPDQTVQQLKENLPWTTNASSR
jgi:hypothetical protein